jgi:hypothetical protein
VVIGGITIAAAAALQDRGSVRLPTPARLDELAGRAESVALEKAGSIAEGGSHLSDTVDARSD